MNLSVLTPVKGRMTMRKGSGESAGAVTIIRIAETHRFIFDMRHTIGRFSKRLKLKPETLYEIVENAVKQITINHDDRIGIYLGHSKSTKSGVVVAWRPPTGPKIPAHRNDISDTVFLTVLRGRSERYAFDQEDIDALAQVRAHAWQKSYASAATD